MLVFDDGENNFKSERQSLSRDGRSVVARSHRSVLGAVGTRKSQRSRTAVASQSHRRSRIEVQHRSTAPQYSTAVQKRNTAAQYSNAVLVQQRSPTYSIAIQRRSTTSQYSIAVSLVSLVPSNYMTNNFMTHDIISRDG